MSGYGSVQTGLRHGRSKTARVHVLGVISRIARIRTILPTVTGRRGDAGLVYCLRRWCPWVLFVALLPLGHNSAIIVGRRGRIGWPVLISYPGR